MNVAKRSTWSTRAMTVPVRPALTYDGVAVHWPGDHLEAIGVGHARHRELFRAIEDYQMDHAGYGGIAYQVLVCDCGLLTEGRTVARVNGANGDARVNMKYGSALALVGIGEHPNDAMLSALLETPAYLNAKKRLFTHNDVRPEPTACPGPDLTAWIKSGYPHPDGDDMDWSDKTKNLVDGSDATFGQLIRQGHRASVEAFNLLAELASKGGVDAAVVEAAVRKVFADAGD